MAVGGMRTAIGIGMAIGLVGMTIVIAIGMEAASMRTAIAIVEMTGGGIGLARRARDVWCSMHGSSVYTVRV